MNNIKHNIDIEIYNSLEFKASVKLQESLLGKEGFNYNAMIKLELPVKKDTLHVQGLLFMILRREFNE